MIIRIKKLLLLYFSKQFLRFLFAGGTGAGINISSRLIFRNYLGFGYEEAYICAYLIGFISIFFLYKKMVFPYSDLPINSQINRFFVINISFAPISALLFVVFTNFLIFVGIEPFAELIAHAISIGSPAVITFLLYKFLAFKKESENLKDIVS